MTTKNWKTKISSILTAATICALLMTAQAGTAQQGPISGDPFGPLGSFDIGPSKAQVAGVVIGIAAVGAAIGVGTYFAVQHSHHLTGCVTTAPDGVQLVSDSDQKIYSLIGDVAGIKSGNRVRVSGKKKHSTRMFLVEKVSKDFGSCTALPPRPKVQGLPSAQLR